MATAVKSSVRLRVGVGFFSLGLIACAVQPESSPGQVPTTTSAEQTWNVVSYGAVGDAKSPASVAIGAAIKACHDGGGGRVEVPAGTYFCTPIELLSNVDLHLDAGATLLFSASIQDYPLAFVDDGAGTIAGVRSPLWSERQRNISISGDGVIDGQGKGWRPTKAAKMPPEQWNKLLESGGVLSDSGDTWYPDPIARDGKAELEHLQSVISTTPLDAFAKYRSLLRPHMIRLTECEGVTISDVTFRQSACWNVHLSLCDDVKMQHVTVFNPSYAQNGDGIDIDSCRNVLIADCKIDAGDDGICIKSGKDAFGRHRSRPTENVKITRCTVGTGHGGVVIGSEMSGGVRNVDVSDCVFRGTDSGLRFKSVRGRGGVVENINVNHIEMSSIGGAAILFDLYYQSSKQEEQDTKLANESTPIFRNFSLRDITCNGAKVALQMRGLPEMPIQNIILNGVNISADQAGTIVDAKNITMKNVHLRASDAGSVQVTHVEQLQLENSTGVVP